MLIAGCSSGGSSSSSSSGGNGTPVSIGTLPNGSTVYISQNNLPVSNGTPAQTSIYLEGGSPNESYNITFATNQQLAIKLNTSESYGINITTSPTPCVIGTAGSGASSQCQVTIASSETTYPGTYVITPSAIPITSSGTATTLSPLTILVSGSIKPSTKAITSFSLNGTAGVITGRNIAVTMPSGTNLAALVATYITTGQSVKVGNVTQVNGVTTNNFTSPVVYTVIAEDGSTQNYTVTVTVAQNSAKALTAFSLNGTAGVITGQNIAVTMPYGTNVTALTATFTTTGQSVKVNNVAQVSGVTPNNFTNPVAYTVIAEDGSTQNYTVTVTVAANSAKAITAFSLNGTAGVISGQNIAVTVPYGTDVTTLIATFTTTGQSVKVNNVAQVSGVTPNNFTNQVVYTVTAEDGSTQNYTVTVTVALSSDNQMIEFSLDGTEGVIDQINKTITVAMPYGTDLSADLTATFLTDGASVTIGSVVQTSGQTPNNFSTPVTYTVHAANGDTRDYVVAVTTKAVISQATGISFAGSYAFLSSNVSSDITRCSVNESQLSNCRNFTIDSSLLPQGASNISALESTAGITLYITGNDNPPSIIQCLLPNGPNLAVTAPCSKINQAVGLQANRLLLATNATPAAESSAKITSFGVTWGGRLINGLINEDNKSIYVALPYGVDMNGLVATFAATGKSVKVNNVLQISGVTTNNYVNNTALPYVVTAKNNTTRTYNVYVYWTTFSGMALNTYASSIKIPVVYSGFTNRMMNLSLVESNGMYVGLNYNYIESFPAGMNATGLSSIALAKTITYAGYNYAMSNIAESMVYACSVSTDGSGIQACSGIAAPQPSSVVAQPVAGLPFVWLYATSYNQNKLLFYSVTPASHDIAYSTELDMPDVFNLPRSLSLSPSYSATNDYWLFALNDGDNSYAACPIIKGNFDQTGCRKIPFSSL